MVSQMKTTIHIPDSVFQEAQLATRDRAILKSIRSHHFGEGLSLVMSIVKAHGGYVEVSSQPGAGSTFTVYLPQGSW